MSGRLAACSLIAGGQLVDEPVGQRVRESAYAASGDEAAFEKGFGLGSGEGCGSAFGLDDGEHRPSETEANHFLQHLGLMRLGLHVDCCAEAA